MINKEKIVLCFNNREILGTYSLLMEKINQELSWNYDLHLSRSGRNCIDFVTKHTATCSTVILDIQIPWELYSKDPSETDKSSINNAIRLLKEIKEKNPLINVILISKNKKLLELGHKEIIQKFASNYIKHVPFQRKHINRYVRECLKSSNTNALKLFDEVAFLHEFTQALTEMRRRYFSDIRLKSKVKSFDSLKSILVPDNVYGKVVEAASDKEDREHLITVLIVGPIGIGKTSIAKIIQSEDEHRKNKPFVEVNLRNIPPNLVGAELFGYKNSRKFSPTKDKTGAFQLAGDGFLFLDEICSLSMELQEELVHAIKSHSILRINTRMRVPVSPKIIATTSCDIPAKIASNEFSPELYKLLTKYEVRIPALSERPSDITKTIEFYCEKYERAVTNDVKEYFLAHPPKENIREIKSTIEYLARISTSKLFNITDFLKAIDMKQSAEKEKEEPQEEPAESKITYAKKTQDFDLLFKELEHIATIGANRDNYEFNKELFPFFTDLLNAIGEKQFALMEHVQLDHIFKGFRKYLIYLYYLHDRDKLFSEAGLAKILGVNDVSIRKIMPKKTIYQLISRS
jgi:DNA-binding NtrC family response regulator